jgi:histidine triad (HIT) family protein
MSDCIFCKIANKEIEARIIWESDNVVAFLDLSPQAPHHVLIVPKKHVKSLAECDEEDKDILGEIQLAAAKIAELLKLEDFRLVTNNGRGAGQSVWHLHYHLLGGRRFNWPPG